MNEHTRILIYANNFQKFYKQMFQPLAAEFNFTQIEIDVLLFLQNNPAYNTARDICQIRGLAKSNVSNAIDSLRKRGYLTTSPDSLSRKVHRLALTPDSVPVLKKLSKRQNYCFSKIMDGFSEEEFKAFRNFMKRMDENVVNTLKNPEIPGNK